MSRREIAFGSIGLLVACAIGFIAYLTTSQSSWSLPLSAILAAIVGLFYTYRGLGIKPVKVVIPRQSSGQDGDPRISFVLKTTETQLIKSIKSIDEKADEVLSKEHGEQRRSLFETKSALKSSNVWSGSDVESFERAIIVRNEIVNGDKPVAEESVSKALTDARHLLEKLNSRLYDSTAHST